MAGRDHRSKIHVTPDSAIKIDTYKFVTAEDREDPDFIGTGSFEYKLTPRILTALWDRIQDVPVISEFAAMSKDDIFDQLDRNIKRSEEHRRIQSS